MPIFSGTPVGGDVSGPTTAVEDELPVFDGDTGKKLKGSGVKVADLATVAQGDKADTAIQPEDLGSAAFEPASAFASAAQGAKADSAVQPGDLGSAAGHAASDFATAAQGTKADSAVQPGALGALATKSAIAVTDITATGTRDATTVLHGDGSWSAPAGGGGGSGAVYSVNGSVGAVVLDADAIDDSATAHKFITQALLTKLGSLNTGTAAGNIPVLDGGGKLSAGVLPALAITDVFEVADQTAMLALDAQQGDIAIRTDLSRTYALAAMPATTPANWKELRTPTDVVLAVAGLTGTITASQLKAALAVTVADISDMSASGRALVQAASYAAMFGLLKQNASTSATGVSQFATTAQYIANTAGYTLTTDQVWAAAVQVAGGSMTGAVTVDFSTFAGASRKNTLTGNVTLGATSNIKKGHSFVWELTQDATGSRTLSLNSTYWETAGGSGITLSTAANAKDILTGYVQDNGKVLLSLAAKAVA